MVFYLINWNIDTFIFGSLNADANECSIPPTFIQINGMKNLREQTKKLTNEKRTNESNQIDSKWALKWKSSIEKYADTQQTHRIDWFSWSKEFAVNFDGDSCVVYFYRCENMETRKWRMFDTENEIITSHFNFLSEWMRSTRCKMTHDATTECLCVCVCWYVCCLYACLFIIFFMHLW